MREKGYTIKPVEEENFAQCEKDVCFQEAKWFREASFYCPKHKEYVLKVLEEADKDFERKKLEQARVIEERRKSQPPWRSE